MAIEYPVRRQSEEEVSYVPDEASLVSEPSIDANSLDILIDALKMETNRMQMLVDHENETLLRKFFPLFFIILLGLITSPVMSAPASMIDKLFKASFLFMGIGVNGLLMYFLNWRSRSIRKKIKRLLPIFLEVLRTASQVNEHVSLPNSIYRVLLKVRLTEADEVYSQVKRYDRS